MAVPASPARREGSRGDPGPKPRGERQLSMSRPGTAPPRGRPGAGAERRGGEGRGARGGTEEGRWHRRLGLGARRKSRSESCERLEEARSAQSGSEVRSEGPRWRRRPPPNTRPARESAAPAAAADGVHLTGEPAGEAGARERSAGRSRASPGRSSAARPRAPARRCCRPRAARPAPRLLQRRPRRAPAVLALNKDSGSVSSSAAAAVAAGPGPVSPRRCWRGGSCSRRARGGRREKPPSLQPPPPRALLLLLPLPPPLRTWSPLSCRRRRLALSSARRGRGSGRSSLPHPPAGPLGTPLESPPCPAGPARRRSSREAAGKRGPGAPSPPPAWPRPRWMCARRWRSAAPELPLVRIWFACIRFQTFAGKRGETPADGAQSELGVFSPCVWLFFPLVSDDPPS